MAVNLLNREVSELCLGKPALRWISAAATVSEALAALKRLGESCLSVWACHCPSAAAECRCVGKVSVADVVCFLARDDNLNSPAAALQSPLADLVPKPSGLVSHLQPNASLLEAIDVILEGATNIVIPIQTRRNGKASSRMGNWVGSTRHNGREYCWITHEDVVRYVLNCIGLLGPAAAAPLASLGLVEGGPAVRHDAPAASALGLLAGAAASGTAVAVVDAEGRLVGEISAAALGSGDETAAAAVATLSAGDLMAYLGCGCPPEDLARAVRERLRERGCVALLDWLAEDGSAVLLSSSSSPSSLCSLSSSSDEEFGGGGKSGRAVRGCGAVVCRPGSSLVAAMIQALAHRSGYVWAVEEDGALDGIVTFAGMLKVLRERLNSMS